MAVEYICKGCRHCRIDLPEDIEDGLCPHCLNRRDFPIRKVEKWEARDGTFHDSPQAAKSHQLMKDIRDALSACQGRPEDQARHLLFHFDIVRRGDTSVRPLPTVEYYKAPKTICTTCYFISGAVIGCVLTQLCIWAM